MSLGKNTQNQEAKELERAFSLSVNLFEQGDFELARQGFEFILKKSKEQEKEGLFSVFKEPSLQKKADSYLKEIRQRQARAEQQEKKTEKQPPKAKAARLGLFARISKKIKTMGRHPLIAGIDISDHSIEILQLDEDGNIKVCARTTLEKGIVESAEIKDAARLENSFQGALKEAGLDVLMKKKRSRIKGLFSLPESKTFIREFAFESRDNLQEKIKEKIKETIPVAFEELSWDYVEPVTRADKIRVLVVAVPEKTINDYLYFFWSQGVDPVVFDIEAASVARALLPPEEQKGGAAIIDIGARTSIINVFGLKKELNLSVSVFYAGNYFTEQVSQKLKITEQAAERKKQELGFEKDPVKPVLEECSAGLVKEIKNALKYHQDKFGFKTDRVILTGGSVLLPGIKDYFQKNFEERVEIGDPLKNIKLGSFLPDKKRAILFANAIGLAMRGLDRNLIDGGINLLTDEIKKQEKTLQRERERFFMYFTTYFLLAVLALLGVIFMLYRLELIKLVI